MRWSLLLLPIVGWFSWCSCYKIPLWSGDVTITPRERESIKKCGTGALTEAGKQTLTREPYLQGTTTTSTSIVWGTRAAAGRVVITDPEGKDIVAASDAVYAGDSHRMEDRRRAQTATKIAADDIFLVTASIEKLEPTRLYCYQVYAGDTALTELAPLATAAAPSKDHIRFIALGDTGTGGAASIAIKRWIASEPFDFLLFLGDIAYESGTSRQLQDNFFDLYRDILKFVPAYPTIGNHERRTRKGRPYLEAFVLPEPERYYSFDWGNVHFVAIDTTHRDAQQLVWLDEDLRLNKLPWVIVYGHHPMYTNSLRGPQLWIRRAFSKILTDHEVDLVLTGHEHHYERFRINDVNYIVSGGGGGQLTRIFGGSRALKQFTVHHFLTFEVGVERLEMRVIDVAGRELEKLSLDKKPSEDKAKVEVNDEPETKQNPVVPEPKIVPDEKLHDKPDDDQDKILVPSAPPARTPPKATP